MAGNWWQHVWRSEKDRSVLITILLTASTGIAAYWLFVHEWWALFGTAMGALGGVGHEFAQSQGRILFFRNYKDGFYLGSVSGLVLGAIAGALAVEGLVIGTAGADVDSMLVGYQGFLGGLALKGVTEAAGTKTIKK